MVMALGPVASKTPPYKVHEDVAGRTTGWPPGEALTVTEADPLERKRSASTVDRTGCRSVVPIRNADVAAEYIHCPRYHERPQVSPPTPGDEKTMPACDTHRSWGPAGGAKNPSSAGRRGLRNGRCSYPDRRWRRSKGPSRDRLRSRYDPPTTQSQRPSRVEGQFDNARVVDQVRPRDSRLRWGDRHATRHGPPHHMSVRKDRCRRKEERTLRSTST